MPKYHFVTSRETPEGQVLPETRLSFYIDSKHDFREATLYVEDLPVLYIDDCGGSLILVDRAREGLNKLHIGELVVKTPHAESYEVPGPIGPRVDLWRFDHVLARQRLDTLESWRDPRVRTKTIQWYWRLRGEHDWYSIPFSLAQLGISYSGLEGKIAEVKAHIARLKSGGANEGRLVSKSIQILEGGFRSVAVAAQSVSTRSQTKINRNREPNLVFAPEVIGRCIRMHASLSDLFDYLERFPEEIISAETYWADRANWANL